MPPQTKFVLSIISHLREKDSLALVELHNGKLMSHKENDDEEAATVTLLTVGSLRNELSKLHDGKPLVIMDQHGHARRCDVRDTRYVTFIRDTTPVTKDYRGEPVVTIHDLCEKWQDDWCGQALNGLIHANKGLPSLFREGLYEKAEWLTNTAQSMTPKSLDEFLTACSQS